MSSCEQRNKALTLAHAQSTQVTRIDVALGRNPLFRPVLDDEDEIDVVL